MPALRWKSVFVAAVISAAPFFAPPFAQGTDAYPSRPIHLVVPFTPGGGTDTLARVLAQQMGEYLRATVITENRPGAGTVIGADYVARSNPDGYTVLLTTSAHAINQTLVPKLPYSVEKSFASVALVGQAPNILVVRPDSRFKSVQDIVTYARAHPGKLTYGSSGTGTAVHLAAELFKSTAHIDLTHVPYKGANPAMTDLLGGQIDMFFGTSGAVLPLVKAGKLRAIAVTSAKPSPAWPGIPTIAESGYPDYVADVWYGVFVAAGTPAPIVQKLNQAVNAAVRSELYNRRMASEGLDSPPSTPAELDAYVQAEVQRWRKVIQDGHITAG